MAGDVRFWAPDIARGCDLDHCQRNSGQRTLVKAYLTAEKISLHILANLRG